MFYKSSFINRRTGQELDIMEFKDIILFPSSGKNNFPYGPGIRKVTERDIVLNIRLTLGLNKKCLKRINNKNNKFC